MVGRIMADILGIAEYIQKAGERGRAHYEKRQIGDSLGRLLAGGDRNAEIAGIAKINPEAALGVHGAMGKFDEASLKRLGQQAAMFVSAPPEVKAQMYPKIAQEANALGFPVPLQHRPEMDEMLAKFAQMVGGMDSGNNVQSRFVTEDGRVVALMRDGSLKDTGEKADRQMWFRDHPGMDPQLVGKDGLVRPVGGYAPQQYAPPPPVQTHFTGADGAPVNIDPSLPPQVQAAIRANEGQWAQAPDQSRANIQTPGQPYNAGAQARPSEAQVAAETEAAKRGVGLQFAPAEAQAEAEKVRQVEGVKASIGIESEIAGKDAERTRSANDTLALLDDAERLLESATGSGLGKVADKAAGFIGVSTEGARATAALNTISGQLVAKMPRMEGPQSDKDVQMYKDMAGNLADASLPIETRKAAAQQIRRLNLKYASGNTPKRAGRLRFNPATGKIE